MIDDLRAAAKYIALLAKLAAGALAPKPGPKVKPLPPKKTRPLKPR